MVFGDQESVEVPGPSEGPETTPDLSVETRVRCKGRPFVSFPLLKESFTLT